MSNSVFPQFDLHQLRCFVAVAEELHFGHAAKRMNMTQPPLARQVQLLEHMLGVKLLDRATNRAVKLTPAGKVFLAEARRILRLTENAFLMTRQIARGEAGTVTVGFIATAAYNFLPRLLFRCGSEAANIHVELKELVSSQQLDALFSGQIDIGLLRPPVSRSDFVVSKVFSERLVAALPTGDLRLSRETLTLQDFDKLPLVMYSQEGARHFHDMLMALLERADVSPVICRSVGQIHSILALVRAGFGAAIVPEAAMALNFDDVHFRPVVTDPVAPSELVAAWRKDNDNPALPTILNILHQLEK
jgi:DNA-binding transcriptional LysR family regulator